MRFKNLRLLAASFLALLILFGCEIEKTTPNSTQTGSISITLTDTLGAEITGAGITLDGTLLAQHTPAVLTDISVGDHQLLVAHPRYEPVSTTVSVSANAIVDAHLTTRELPYGTIELAGAPDGTVFVVNALPYATLPPNTIQLGTGLHSVSAFLAGHATLLPARWPVTVTPGDTITLTPQFQPLGSGGRVDSLAPVFYLPSDYDSNIVSIGSFRGYVTVVTFFYYNCAPCLEEFPSIQAVYTDPEFSGQVQFFALDDADAWTIFITYREDHPALGLTFPLLWDRGAQISQQYQVLVHPVNFIIDKTGRIRYRLGQINQNILRDAISTLLAEGE